MSEYTAIVKQDGDWLIGWLEEVAGVNCQEASREALLETLRITPISRLPRNIVPGAAVRAPPSPGGGRILWSTGGCGGFRT